jgi:hypothetical protein
MRQRDPSSPDAETTALLGRSTGDVENRAGKPIPFPALHGNNGRDRVARCESPLDTADESIHVPVKSKRVFFFFETTI